MQMTMRFMNDAEAIRRARREPECFRLVFDRHYDAVWRYLRHRFRPELADELASETFARAFAARARYQPQTDSALPWLLGIATRLIADERRREARRLRAYAHAATDDSGAHEETEIVARLSARADGARIARAIAGLRPEDKETLLLSAIADLSHAEVAEALDVAEGTIGARMNRIRARLLPLLVTPEPEEEVANG